MPHPNVNETKRRPGRPATGVTPMRSFRMGTVYDAAAEVAERRGEKLKDVIERKLQEYISEHAEV